MLHKHQFPVSMFIHPLPKSNQRTLNVIVFIVLYDFVMHLYEGRNHVDMWLMMLLDNLMDTLLYMTLKSK